MSNDKHEIEEYKGHTIYYHEYDDKFHCSISIEDNFKETKRKSLVDVRREIDTFIKENLNFKPFKAIEIDKYSRDSPFKMIDVLSIRSDKN